MDSDDLILTCCDLSSWKLNPLSLQRRGQPGYRGTTTTPSKATANRGLTHTTLSFLALKPRGRAAEPAATWQILQVIYSPHGNPTLYLLSFPPTPRSHRPAAPRPFPAPRFPHFPIISPFIFQARSPRRPSPKPRAAPTLARSSCRTLLLTFSARLQVKAIIPASCWASPSISCRLGLCAQNTPKC